MPCICNHAWLLSDENVRDDMIESADSLTADTVSSRVYSDTVYTVGCVAQLAECWSLADELTLFCARPAVDG